MKEELDEFCQETLNVEEKFDDLANDLTETLQYICKNLFLWKQDIKNISTDEDKVNLIKKIELCEIVLGLLYGSDTDE